MASTRNIDKSMEYSKLQAYAGVSRVDIEAAGNKKGIIKSGGMFRKKSLMVKEIKIYGGENLQESVDNVVKSVPSGEYLYNAYFYVITEAKGSLFGTPVLNHYFICGGDVWGVNKEEWADNQGFRKGDSVMFIFSKELKKELKKNFNGEVGKQYLGEIITLKGRCVVVKLENGVVVDVPYLGLRKAK